MSRTEMVAFKTNGDAVHYKDIDNAWRGAMAIWKVLERKYLPPYKPTYIPSHIPLEKVEEFLGFKPSRLGGSDEEGMKDVWNLYGEERVAIVDKIVLGTTFDRVLVKKENIDEIIHAFQAFEGVTSLKEQATVLEEMSADDDLIAFGWNQTSITENQWLHANYEAENDRYMPYNCLQETKHFWLFDDINKMR